MERSNVLDIKRPALELLADLAEVAYASDRIAICVLCRRIHDLLHHLA